MLMVADADSEALGRTVTTGEMHLRWRTRGLWHKGAMSGNVQRVVSLAPDCDGDAVLARVTPAGPACHTGTTSCFGAGALAADELGVLDLTIGARAGGGAPPRGHDGASRAVLTQPADAPSPAATHADAPDPARPPARPSYTQRLLADRNLRLKKIGEEAAELVTACADADRHRAAEEGADLLYHTLVALRAVGVTLDDVRRVLAARAR